MKPVSAVQVTVLTAGKAGNSFLQVAASTITWIIHSLPGMKKEHLFIRPINPVAAAFY